MTPWEKKIKLHIAQNRPIEKEDIRELLWDGYVVDEEYGESLRWVTPVTSIIEFFGHYYMINWYRGNTEYQENEYESQVLEEVEKVKKIVEIEEWVVKKT